MPDWKQTDLCLCHFPNVASAGHCFRTNKLQWTNGVTLQSPMDGQSDLPLVEICNAAVSRRRKSRQTQVLLLYNAAARGDVRAVRELGVSAWVHAVEVCSLDHIGHADILLALTLGFDRVVVQQLSTPTSKTVQQQEVELTVALGGKGRVELFGSRQSLVNLMVALPRVSGRWRVDRPANTTRRRASVRACATALLPARKSPVPLPSDAPYGTISLDITACTGCQSCVWVCPTDALSVDESTGDLTMKERQCIQCGMCCSICPSDALRLDPRMNPLAEAKNGLPLKQAKPALEVPEKRPIEIKSVMDRLAKLIWGKQTSAEV